MATFTQGEVRKHKARNGSWSWQGVVTVTEDDGSRRTVTKVFGIPCDPKAESEKGKRATGGKGYNTAKSRLTEWRDSLIKQYEDDKKRAEEEARQLAIREAMPEPSKLNVPEYVAYYIESRATGGEEGIQQSTRDNYYYALKHLERPELDVPITDLNGDHVKEWVKATADEGVGSSIRARAFSLLKYSLQFAIDMGHRNGMNPCRPIKAPVAHRREANPLDNDNLNELNKQLDRLNKRRPDRRDFVDAVRLALMTAMRQGELCGLRWMDVDGYRSGKFETGSKIHVRKAIANAGKNRGGVYLKDAPKSGKPREIPLNDDLVAFFKSRLAYSKELCLREGIPFQGTMFVLGKPSNDSESGYLSPNYLGKMWRMFVDTTDLIGRDGLVPHFHDLRHTAATHMLSHGIPVQTVAGILGHARPDITYRFYSKYLDEDAKKAMQDMDGHFTNSGQTKRSA